MENKQYKDVLGPEIPVVCGLAFVLTGGYELFKQILFPEITLWQSHALTILIFTAVSGLTAYLIRKKQTGMAYHTQQLQKENQAFKNRLYDSDVRRQERKDWERTFDAIEDWISIISLDSVILRSNRTVEKFFEIPVQSAIGLKCCSLAHGTDGPLNICPIPRMLETRKRETADVKIKNGRWMRVTVDPIFDKTGNIAGAVHIARDITFRVRRNREREQLLADLQEAVTHIRTLKGLIPICAKCKKIRDDKGFWKQLESYIEENSEAAFSHGMCPECTEELYGDQEWYIQMKKETGGPDSS